MDDFGNSLHWTTQVQGWHSLGLYGWTDDYGMGCLMAAVDFNDLQP